MSAEVGLTEAEGVRRALEDWMIDNRWAYEAYDFSHALVASDWLARIKADAIAQERAAWVAQIEALASCPHGPRHYYAVDATCQRCEMPSWVEAAIRALLPPDATAACACACHSGVVGTGCRQSRCEVCPPATAALNTAREQAKAEGRVHNHPPYRPACNERLVEGQLRGACLNDDGSEAGR